MTPEQLQRLRGALAPIGNGARSDITAGKVAGSPLGTAAPIKENSAELPTIGTIPGTATPGANSGTISGTIPEWSDFGRYYGTDFTARQPGLEHLTGYVSSGQYRLAVQHWRQPDARSNLLLVHGYYDHTGLFGKLIGWALSAGCNVLSFDLPGHGLSSGEPAVIDEFAQYGAAVADVLAQVSLPALPLWTMAQSTGGAALIEFARRGDWPFVATVLLAPLVRPAGWRGIRIAHTLLRPFTGSVARRFNVNSADREFLAFVRGDPLQCQRVPLAWIGALDRWLADLPRRDLGVGPALVVQGDRDHTVDWRYNVGIIRQLFPGSRVDYVAGAGHQLANESAELRAQYLRVVAAYLAECGVPLQNEGQG